MPSAQRLYVPAIVGPVSGIPSCISYWGSMGMLLCSCTYEVQPQCGRGPACMPWALVVATSARPRLVVLDLPPLARDLGHDRMPRSPFSRQQQDAHVRDLNSKPWAAVYPVHVMCQLRPCTSTARRLELLCASPGCPTRARQDGGDRHPGLHACSAKSTS
jgi:hypothetical protein